MGKFIFDGALKVIEGDPAAVTLDPQGHYNFTFTAQELYTEAVDWWLTGDNSKYPFPFLTSGGDPLGGGVYLGVYVFLRNDLGWIGVPPDVGNVHVEIVGNFYPYDPAQNFFVPWPGVITIVQSRVSQMTQAIATSGSSFTPAEMASAVLAAAQVTPIHANMEQTNGYNLVGDGTEGNKFRSHLVP